MARKREVVQNSSEEFISIQDVLYAFNNSLSEEQAWAVCYQCAQVFEQTPTQDNFRDLYYYGITAIRLSKEGDIKIEVNFNQGSGKGPPRKRSSFSLSKEFKTVITPLDVRQALGTAIYKALDYGLSESEEPHLSSDLEALIESLTDHPTDDDEGIDIERDSDQDIDDSQGQEQSEFQDIIDSCVRRLSSQQNAQLHYKAVCRALATETSELVTFLDNIVKGQEKLASTKDDKQPSVDDLERSDWARLWVQIMRELRHGVRLKKVEQVHLLPVEFELTPFEILLEDIRLGRYKLNRIMVNGDIPRTVKDDAHAVILDFIRSRPPLKPVNRRKLKDKPQNMDPRELLLEDIRKPQTLKPVKHGRLVVRKPTLDCDTNYSSEEESPKQVRKVIKPVAAFQVSNGSQEVSTDDSDSYFSDPEDDYRNHINAPVMSPLDPVYPDADDVTWKRAVARDLARQPSNTCRSVSRRHTISACDIKSGKKVSTHSQHAPLPEEEEADVVHSGYFNRGHAARKATKIISYRKKHQDVQHASRDNPQTVPAQNCLNDRPKSPLRHVGQCVLSKSHGNLVNSVFSVHNNLHEMSSSDTSRLSRSASVASISEPRRCMSPNRHVGRSQSPRMHAGRPESPVCHLSRSETFTCSVPRKSRVSFRNDTHVATRCDSPQTRAMKHSDSFPPPRSESPIHSGRPESPRRHSVHMVHSSNDIACDTQVTSDNVRRHSVQHVHGSVSHSSGNLRKSRTVQRNASFAGACLSRSKHESNKKEAWTENYRHGNGSNSQASNRDMVQDRSDNISPEVIKNSLSKSVKNNDLLQNPKTSNPQDKVSEINGRTADSVTLRRSRTAIVRARSRPDVRSKDIKDEEEKHFQFIERSGTSKLVNDVDTERSRPSSEIDFNQRTRSQVTRARSSVERSMVSRSVDSRIPVRSEKTATGVSRTDSSKTENGESDPLSKPKRGVRLSRQSAIRTEGSDIRSKLQSKTAGERATEKPVTDTGRQSGPVSDTDNKLGESRTRRVGVIANERNVTNSSKSAVADSNSKQEVTSSEMQKTSRRHEFRQVRPILRSRSEVRPEMKPVKGSHNLPVDFEHNHLNHLDDKHVIIPPPEFRDPDDNTTPTNETSTLIDDTGSIPDVIKTSRAEFKVVDLLHVSWKTECSRQDPTNKSNPCSDCRPFPSHKWQNPIECLSLTLEEVTHIRCVLTKAELESLITNPELYSQVSKGKVCFTCKKTKFSLFGQWGTKCKFCQRTVCNYCLRKMSVPTEHFEKIPVYTLSPVPLSPEMLEALKVYESTGSVPHSPVTSRKLVAADSNNKTSEEPDTPVSEENRTATRRKSLQRSHTIGVGVGSRPPPNKALLKGPQMSICCDCKTMIMEIIRASRSSVSLVTGKSEAQEGDKNKDSLTPRSQVSARSSVVMRPRHLDLEERPRPRSMLDNFKSFNFTRTGSDA